jgi:hypothetical protein
MTTLWRRIIDRKPMRWEKPAAYIIGPELVAAVLAFGLAQLAHFDGLGPLAGVLGLPSGTLLAALIGALLGILFALGGRRTILGFIGFLAGAAVTVLLILLLAPYQWVLDVALRVIFGPENVITMRSILIILAIFWSYRYFSWLTASCMAALLYRRTVQGAMLGIARKDKTAKGV